MVKLYSPIKWLTAMVKPSTDVQTNTRNFTTWRFGQSYSEDDIDKACRRNPVLKFLSHTIYDIAFSDGMEIRDSNTDDLRVDDVSDELDKQRVLEALIPVAQTASKYGSCTAALFESVDRFDNIYTEIKGFRPKRVRMDFPTVDELEDNGNDTSYALLPIRYQLEEILPYPNVPNIISIDIDQEEFDNIFHIVPDPDPDNWYKGISEMDPVWDIAHGHQVILESSMVCSVRVAYGIRKATIMDRGDPTKNTALANKMEEGLKKLESGDTSIILWGGVNDKGQVFQDSIEVDTGSVDFNYTEKLDMYHRTLAMITGIPKNWWDGIFQGSTIGAEVAKSILKSALKDRRKKFTMFFTDIFRRWCELNNFQWQDSYYLAWKQEPILTEREEAEIDNIKATTDQTLISARIKSIEEVRESRDLKGPIPEPPVNPNMINFGFNDNNDTSNNDNEEEE